MALRAKIQTVGVPRVQRAPRRPSHTFQLRARPFQIQPMMLAPVLPGETLKNLLLQARVVTDPIKNPLIGWWCEYYFFYVKHRDIQENASAYSGNTAPAHFEDMMVNPNFVMPVGLQGPANVTAYHYGGHINWVGRCRSVCVEEYFRMEGELSGDYHLGDNIPIASAGGPGWLDSVRNEAEVTSLDFDVDSADANTTIQASELENAMVRWQMLRMNQLTDMSYEEYLQSYGIRPPSTEAHIPELVRYVRDWQYPVSHVEPTTGVPSSAVSWKIAERADKDRFFKEPGFLVGFQVIRPKVYFRNSIGSAADLMENALTWLPSVLGDEVSHSLVKVANGASGPLSSNTTPYWVDIRDLLMYGDQFLNFDLAATDAGLVALPTAALQKRYPSSADVDALFKAAAPANLVRSDGRVDLTIMGRQLDLTSTS